MRKYLTPPKRKTELWVEAERFLSKDKYIGPLIKKHGPCKIKPSKKKDYFYDLVDAICSQQLSGKAAATILNRVRVGLGNDVSPIKILKVKDEKFRSWGLSWAKIKYIKDLSQKVKSREVEIEKLNRLPDEEVIKELVSVKGIGRWTSEMFLMFSLAREDVFPVDDLGINKGVEKLLKKRVSSQKMAEFSLRWKPYRTAASWYIWRSLD